MKNKHKMNIYSDLADLSFFDLIWVNDWLLNEEKKILKLTII